MQNKVNLSKVAKEMGLSVSTVSRALSGNGRISEETRKKVAAYLKDKNLVPNTRERRYTDLKTRIVAVTIPEEEDFFFMPYFQTILFSIYDYFSIRGYQVIPIKTNAYNIINLEQAVRDHAMDGVIISRVLETHKEIELLQEERVPFVQIGRLEDVDIMQVDANIEGACFDLTNALIHKGYHRIAVMCSRRLDPINELRLKGIMRAYVQNYMVLNREFVFWETETSSIAELAIEKILLGKQDCILCMDDNICLKVLLILGKMGINIPQQIKVASLHNSSLLEKWNPSITCVHYDANALGKEAGKMLHACLTEGRRLENVMLGYEIQMKESTS